MELVKHQQVFSNQQRLEMATLLSLSSAIIE
jgi:hypothetical protein